MDWKITGVEMQDGSVLITAECIASPEALQALLQDPPVHKMPKILNKTYKSKARKKTETGKLKSGTAEYQRYMRAKKKQEEGNNPPTVKFVDDGTSDEKLDKTQALQDKIDDVKAEQDKYYKGKRGKFNKYVDKDKEDKDYANPERP